MNVYKSKYWKLPGSDYDEVIKLARQEYHIAQIDILGIELNSKKEL